MKISLPYKYRAYLIAYNIITEKMNTTNDVITMTAVSDCRIKILRKVGDYVWDDGSLYKEGECIVMSHVYGTVTEILVADGSNVSKGDAIMKIRVDRSREQPFL
jgi:acetyl/propionyl-CoA carboxylase alpha subunit